MPEVCEGELSASQPKSKSKDRLSFLSVIVADLYGKLDRHSSETMHQADSGGLSGCASFESAGSVDSTVGVTASG